MLTISESCTRCGLCKSVCPAFVISLDEGAPSLAREGCIRCGHCEAVCPVDALRNRLVPEDDKPLLPDHPVVDAGTAELFLRSRRSIRCFRRDEVPQELTRRLLNVGRCCQTGSNSQGITFLVAGTETLEALRELAMDFFRTAPDPAARSLYDSFSDPAHDRLLRGAPMCILALTRRDHPYTAANARYALTYVEAMAPALGLGTCWVGFLERYTSIDSPGMRRLLKLPDELVVSGALLYGYPKISYRRVAGRSPLQVLWR